MFIAIHRVSEAQDEKGVYKVYDIYIDGTFHCSVRYSQLLNLHEELKKNYDTTKLPPFPSKKLLGLTQASQEERRYALEKYLQQACQDNFIGKSGLLRSFLLQCQQATWSIKDDMVELDVYLVNGKNTKLKVKITDSSDDVLEKVAKKIELQEEFTYYFALFFKRFDKSNQSWETMRFCQPFESPYITLNYSFDDGEEYRIYIQKTFWNNEFIDSLLTDRTAKNLLYVEAIASLDNGSIETSPQIKQSLSTLQSKGSKKEFLELIRTVPQYGFVQIDDITISHPEEDSKGFIRIGDDHMLAFTRKSPTTYQMHTYKVQRIKCWKVSTHDDLRIQLSFNYLIAKDTLEWIYITGPYTILLSMLLQSVVNELIMNIKQMKIRKPGDERKDHVDWNVPPVRHVRKYQKMLKYPSSHVDNSQPANGANGTTTSTSDVTDHHDAASQPTTKLESSRSRASDSFSDEHTAAASPKKPASVSDEVFVRNGKTTNGGSPTINRGDTGSSSSSSKATTSRSKTTTDGGSVTTRKTSTGSTAKEARTSTSSNKTVTAVGVSKRTKKKSVKDDDGGIENEVFSTISEDDL